jgi:3-hydroxyisobutyrate dehydrogenase-like beta-hydroxyacid dehydrogenase
MPDLDELVGHAEIVLSVLPPAEALGLANRLASSIRRTGAQPLVADCNAIAPSTTQGIGRVIDMNGTRFVDACIIGPPPTLGSTATRVYASGPHADELSALVPCGLDVRVIGDAVGQASGLKMCYASVTKGLTAIATQQQVAATALGLSESLIRELEISQPELLEWMKAMVPGMPPKAYRWIGEMEEIAVTFDAVGVSPGMMLGAAQFYRDAAATRLSETPARPSTGDSMEAVAWIFVKGRAREVAS